MQTRLAQHTEQFHTRCHPLQSKFPAVLSAVSCTTVRLLIMFPEVLLNTVWLTAAFTNMP